MEGDLISALIMLVVMYILVWMRGMNEPYAEVDAAVAEYKQKVMLMFAKYGRGNPIDIAKLDPDLLNEMFKDFLITFNEFQAKSGGKPVTQADVQSIFPIDFLNEYNAEIVKR